MSIAALAQNLLSLFVGNTDDDCETMDVADGRTGMSYRDALLEGLVVHKMRSLQLDRDSEPDGFEIVRMPPVLSSDRRRDNDGHVSALAAEADDVDGTSNSDDDEDFYDWRWRDLKQRRRDRSVTYKRKQKNRVLRSKRH
ncbi:MAG: hypothetical protein MHM6MM_002925 [Cercozoa sp. M6MM]